MRSPLPTRSSLWFPFGVLQCGHWKSPVPETVLPGEDAVLEVVSPDGARRYVRVTQSPFLIGRGAETGNHLQLSDRRISRNCAALVIETNRFYLEDRGQRRGLFVNGEKRSEEHTSELQSRLHLVCRLLLAKKKPTAYIRSLVTIPPTLATSVRPREPNTQRSDSTPFYRFFSDIFSRSSSCVKCSACRLVSF